MLAPATAGPGLCFPTAGEINGTGVKLLGGEMIGDPVGVAIKLRDKGWAESCISFPSSRTCISIARSSGSVSKGRLPPSSSAEALLPSTREKLKHEILPGLSEKSRILRRGASSIQCEGKRGDEEGWTRWGERRKACCNTDRELTLVLDDAK